MAKPTKSMSSKKSAKKKPAPATRRSTSGVGFEFEDLISAWLMVKMLTGEQAPAIGGDGIQLQAQVSAQGWHIDDILLAAKSDTGEIRRLAISAKGNPQVTSSGLPADFVALAWKQWNDTQSPMNASCDGLALVTRGNNTKFDATWKEIKDACSDSDTDSAVMRIRGNTIQSKVFDSVQKPDREEPVASDAETVELIRLLYVMPLDLQLDHSDTETQSITQCRQLLVSGNASEAQKLWEELVTIATNVRLRLGTITLEDLWSSLRKQFNLHHHPDYSRDWETLSNITDDYKARIATQLPSGYSVPRTEEKSKLETAISASVVTVVSGESGSGKSALVKDVLDTQFGGWTQVWFGPDELKTALSAARRGTLPLRHELTQILNSTTNQNNALVIDSAEHIAPSEFNVIQQLIQGILPDTRQVDDSVWHVIFITQPQSRGNIAGTILNGHQATSIELGPLDALDVKSALMASPSLNWLTGHDETIAALTNLRTLAWVESAGTSLNSHAGKLTSHTSIADHLWGYWTEGRADAQALMMRLAEREASFERSFPLTGLDSADVTTFTQRPSELPLHLNQRTNSIEFEHDLAADWARFQFLKQIWMNTSQWAPLAENPLWTNALRMLGQYLLRQSTKSGSAWDTSFKAAAESELRLAGNILLDALCLDPEAERFLTERVDMLLMDNGKLFTRLLIRFHHIGTVPAGDSLNAASSLELYIETQFRSVIIGRWPPILRFIISQRGKLNNLVSTALAKVIHTWLTDIPHEFMNGTPVPFRRELAEIALAMVRKVQVEKGHGVIYSSREPLLYLAPLAGASDLPDEIGIWALELAGRREVAKEVTERIFEVRLQEAKKRAKRLQTDPVYKAKYKARRQTSPISSLGREKLSPWPLGARRKVDMDFRDACLKNNGIKPLMHACPGIASEVLLALIIEDQPERDYSSSRHEIELGLEYAQGGYPTAFWKSPFFTFLQIEPNVSLEALIALVNFCTERWTAEIMDGLDKPAPGLTLQLAQNKKIFIGGYQVFDWTQSSSLHNGHLFSALDALERWLTLQLDTGIDITPYIEQILEDGASASLIGLLINVGKYHPSLFSGVLAPVLTDPYAFYWDRLRVEQIGNNIIGWNSSQEGKEIFNFAKSWVLSSHRQKTLLSVAVELLHTNDAVAEQLQSLIPNWLLPENKKSALEFKILFACLDQKNYKATVASEAGNEPPTFEYPDNLKAEIQSWQNENEKPLQHLLLPEHCEKLLRAQQILNDEDAAYLYNLFKECEVEVTTTGAKEDESDRFRCRISIASALIVLAESWLNKTPKAKEDCLSIIRITLGEVTSTTEDFRSRRIGYNGDNLMFAACAVTHLWITKNDQTLEWEASLLKLLTSGDSNATGAIVSIAYRQRQQLGPAWWRLLQAGLLWSGLIMLAPHYEKDKNADRIWGVWLARLRRFPLKGGDASIDDLNIVRIAAGCQRLDFYRRMRAFESGKNQWRGKPERRTGMGVANDYLEQLFHWLIKGTGTSDWPEDTRLLEQLWAYEAGHAKENSKKDYGEYGLLSHLGYDLLLKLAELTLSAPEAEARLIWEPVLKHGPQAHYAIQHFISCLFQHLQNDVDPHAFEHIWRETIEYALASKWDKPGLWFYGERLTCDLLGFNHEAALLQLESGTALRMRDIYERWANIHLKNDEECTTRFCYFLTTEFGAPLRLDGLRWIANMFKANNPSDYWYREGTGKALIELINTSLNQDTHALSSNSQAREALVEIAATLAAKNIPTALSLQERIKRLR